MTEDRCREISRRALFGGALATGALAVPGAAVVRASDRSVPTAAKRRRYRERSRVDLHCHYLAPAYYDALRVAGITAIGGIPVPQWTPDLALKFMKDQGIGFQLLSVSDPGVSFAADPAALARACNDYVAGVIRAHPDKIGAFAVVGMSTVDAARAEVARALDQLRLDGVGLLSSYAGRYLGDPQFEPLMADLDRRRAWVFVHPTAISADDRPDYGLPNFVAEYPFDTTRTILSLMFNGTFKRHPNIRWHFAHGGGTVPMLRFRLGVLADVAKGAGALLRLPPGSSILVERDAAAALRRAHYDTALIADAPALAAVEKIAAVSQMFFGSDYPFAATLYPGPGDPQPALSRSFTNDERRRIDRLNARKQFRRVRQAVPGAGGLGS
jgi:predicted TIM-barrel fold metal-dependent hydrolase